jgi:hypothetical protein
MVKVGMAFDPEERRKQLITGHPYDLSVAHIQECGDVEAWMVEDVAHAILNAHGMKGEWFSISVEQATLAVVRANKICHSALRTAKRMTPPEIVTETKTKRVYVDRPVEVVKEVVKEVVIEKEVAIDPTRAATILDFLTFEFFTGVGLVVAGIILSMVGVIAVYTGSTPFPDSITERNAVFLGEWTRVIAFLARLNPYVAGPLSICVGVSFLMTGMKFRVFTE